MPYPLGHWVTTGSGFSHRLLTRCHHRAPPRAPRPRVGRRVIWEPPPAAAARACAPLRPPPGPPPAPPCACAWPSPSLCSATAWPARGSLWAASCLRGSRKVRCPGCALRALGELRRNSNACPPSVLILFTWMSSGVCVAQSSVGPPSAACRRA